MVFATKECVQHTNISVLIAIANAIVSKEQATVRLRTPHDFGYFLQKIIVMTVCKTVIATAKYRYRYFFDSQRLCGQLCNSVHISKCKNCAEYGTDSRLFLFCMSGAAKRAKPKRINEVIRVA